MAALVNDDVFQNTIDHWKYMAPIIHEPQNADDYKTLSGFLDRLLDVVGENESHELMGLVDIISHMIAIFDEEHDYEFEKASGIDALKFLMEQYHFKQTDLKEIGSQGVVSEILSGKRKLNLAQIKKLSEKFQVSPDTFID